MLAALEAGLMIREPLRCTNCSAYSLWRAVLIKMLTNGETCGSACPRYIFEKLKLAIAGSPYRGTKQVHASSVSTLGTSLRSPPVAFDGDHKKVARRRR
jgi:hypothetical protein